MVDILHRVGVASTTPDQVYEALVDPARLAQWWTTRTTGEGTPGGTLEFRFDRDDGFDMKVLDTVPGEHVAWEVVGGPDDWIGTTISFDLRPHEDGWTIVMFTHADWREPVEFMHGCSTKWATFLLSLKSLLETGEGTPWPHDVKIDDHS